MYQTLQIALDTAIKLGHKGMQYMIASRLDGERAMVLVEERPQPTAALKQLGSPQKFTSSPPRNDIRSSNSSNSCNNINSSSQSQSNHDNSPGTVIGNVGSGPSSSNNSPSRKINLLESTTI